jgi:tetratricopeptide (TPR) repeat protein
MSLANLLSLRHRHREAEAAFRELVRRHPDHAEARFRLGGLLLTMGRYEEGWALYEARYDPTRKGAPDPIDFGCPQWLGEPLEGRTLLVWYEQGHGDEIQFCRYVPMLKAMGAAKVTVVCKPALQPLLATLEGIDRLVPAAGVHEIETHDYWTYLLSLPHRFATRLETIPARVPYLSALPERRACWAPRVPKDGFHVGLAWKGNPELANDANRSLPSLATLRPLWDVPGVTFVSLQKGVGEAEAASPAADQPILNLGGMFEDFGDSAALIEALDLVISVDTAPAHLAGALGKPCFCLVPAEGLDFRWLLERSDSPWYPTLTLFRRPLGAAWDVVMPRVAEALGKAVRRSARAPAS